MIIPAFALGRTQEILYHLSALAEAGRLDPATVFLDSPMAIDATEIYQRAESEHDEELAALDPDPLGAGRFQRCRTVEQSKALNSRGEPAVIVAGSGMANAGRVVHHLLHRLGDRRSAVVFAGYQAAGTRGRALLDGAETVAIQGQTAWVKAQHPPAPEPLRPRRPRRVAALVPGAARAAAADLPEPWRGPGAQGARRRPRRGAGLAAAATAAHRRDLPLVDLDATHVARRACRSAGTTAGRPSRASWRATSTSPSG